MTGIEKEGVRIQVSEAKPNKGLKIYKSYIPNRTNC